MRNTTGLTVTSISLFLALSAGAAAQGPTTAVNFNHLTHPRNQMGFMHGALGAYWNSSSNKAVENRAKLLNPLIWRGNEALWSLNTKTITRTGAMPIYTLSAGWQAVLPNPKRGCSELFWNRNLPFQNWAVWKKWVSKQADHFAALRPRGDIWIDIWNEPDHPKFWPVERRDKCYSSHLVDKNGGKWLKTFLVAEQVIRARLGRRAKILGPSVSSKAMQWSSRLVNYCARYHCRLDALAWHICGGGQSGIDRIAPEVRRAKRLMKVDHNWKSVLGTNGQVMMTEYASNSMHLRPAGLLSYWYALERSLVAASALSIWKEPDGSKLAGMLTAAGRPKPLWWAARAYAAGRRWRVASSTNNGYWSILASRHGITNGPEFLLGNNHTRRFKIKVLLRELDGLGFRHYIRVDVINLARTRSGVVMNKLPKGRRSSWIRVVHGSAALYLSPAPGSALLVSIHGH